MFFNGLIFHYLCGELAKLANRFSVASKKKAYNFVVITKRINFIIKMISQWMQYWKERRMYCTALALIPSCLRGKCVCAGR